MFFWIYAICHHSEQPSQNDVRVCSQANFVPGADCHSETFFFGLYCPLHKPSQRLDASARLLETSTRMMYLP